MIPLVESRLAEIADLCRQFDVRRLEIFGSGTRSDFRAGESDLDFLVEFAEPLRPGYFDRFFGFKEALEEMFGVSVDLVVERAIRNRYFLESVNEDRSLLYAA